MPLFELCEKREWVLFCAQMGLIQNNFHCDQCNNEMAFVNYAPSIVYVRKLFKLKGQCTL